MTCEQFDLETDLCTDSSRWLPPVPVKIWHNMRVHGGHWDLCYKPGDPLELVLRWDVPGGMDPLGFALDLHSPGYRHEPGCLYADEARDALAAVTRVTGEEGPDIISAGDVAVVAGAAYAVTTNPVRVWRAIEMPAPCLSRGGGGVSVHRTQQAGPPLPVTLDGSDEFAVWVARRAWLVHRRPGVGNDPPHAGHPCYGCGTDLAGRCAWSPRTAWTAAGMSSHPPQRTRGGNEQ